MPTLEEILKDPQAQTLLSQIMTAAAAENLPQDTATLATAMAITAREEAAAKTRAAIQSLTEIVPTLKARADFLDRATSQATIQPTAKASLPPSHAEEPSPDGRGGKREGSGRKTKTDDAKTVNRTIALYPEEWEQLDAISHALGTTRSGTIRRMLAAMPKS